MSTEVAPVVETKKTLRIKKNTKTPVVPEIHPSGEASTAPKSSKKTKSTTAHVDEMLTAIQTHFKLPEKDFKEVVSAFVSKTSQWNKKNKKRRAEGEPAKHKSAYIFFTMKNRPAVSEQMEKETGAKPVFTEITVRLGKMWNELTDKSEFEQLAKADKERYEKEHAAYLASRPAEATTAPVKAKRARKAPAESAPAEGSSSTSAPVEAKVKKPRKKAAEVVAEVSA